MLPPSGEETDVPNLSVMSACVFGDRDDRRTLFANLSRLPDLAKYSRIKYRLFMESNNSSLQVAV